MPFPKTMFDPIESAPIPEGTDRAALRREYRLSQKREENLGNENFLTRAAKRGVFDTRASLAGLVSLGGKLTGMEGMQDWGANAATELSERASTHPGTEFGDINGIGSGAKWAAEKLVENIPFMVASGGAAGLGAKVIGGAIIKGAAGRFLTEAAAKKAGMSAANATVKGIADNNAKNIGAKLGVIGSTAAIESGGDFQEIEERTGGDVPDIAPYTTLGAGIIKGFVETLGGQQRIIDRVLGRDTGGMFRRALDRMESSVRLGGAPSPKDFGFVRRTLGGLVKVGGEEMGQETAQELISLANIGMIDPSFTTFTSENAQRILESGLAGLAVGGIMGGANSLMTGRAKFYGDKFKGMSDTALEEAISGYRGKAETDGKYTELLDHANKEMDARRKMRSGREILDDDGAGKRPIAVPKQVEATNFQPIRRRRTEVSPEEVDAELLGMIGPSDAERSAQVFEEEFARQDEMAAKEAVIRQSPVGAEGLRRDLAAGMSKLPEAEENPDEMTGSGVQYDGKYLNIRIDRITPEETPALSALIGTGVKLPGGKKLGEVTDVLDGVRIYGGGKGWKKPYREDLPAREDDIANDYAQILHDYSDYGGNEGDHDLTISDVVEAARKELNWLTQNQGKSPVQIRREEAERGKYDGMTEDEAYQMEENYIAGLKERGFDDDEILRVRESGYDENVIAGIESIIEEEAEREAKSELQDEGEDENDVMAFFSELADNAKSEVGPETAAPINAVIVNGQYFDTDTGEYVRDATPEEMKVSPKPKSKKEERHYGPYLAMPEKIQRENDASGTIVSRGPVESETKAPETRTDETQAAPPRGITPETSAGPKMGEKVSEDELSAIFDQAAEEASQASQAQKDIARHLLSSRNAVIPKKGETFEEGKARFEAKKAEEQRIFVVRPGAMADATKPASEHLKAASEELKAGMSDIADMIKLFTKDQRGSARIGKERTQEEEARYAALRGLMESSYTHFVNAGKSIAEWMKTLIAEFTKAGIAADAIKPHVLRFYGEMTGDAKESIDTTENNAHIASEKQNNPVKEKENGGEREGGYRESGDMPVVEAASDLAHGQPSAPGGETLREGGTREISEGGSGGGVRGKKAHDQKRNVGNGSGKSGVRDDGRAESGVRGGAEADTGTSGAGNRGLGEQTGRGRRENNHIIRDEDTIVPAGKPSRIAANIEAIRTLKKLESENRPATPEEKRTMAKFVGWGGLSEDVFDIEFSGYADYYGENLPERINSPHFSVENSKKRELLAWYEKAGKHLHPKLGGMLTREEWDAAKASTLNAHYTERNIIQRGLWGLARHLGFNGGTVLEPAAGIGHIIGLMPQDFAGDVSVVGVELDSISGRMLKKLYPDARIHVSGFQDVKSIKDNSVDLVISNFPFGNIPIHDKLHPEYSGWSIHNYFFGRSIDALRPGGIVVAITSHYTLDSGSNTKMRRTLANKADFIGAIRLPKTAFAKNAGAEVVTDIVVMRKKDGVSGELAQPFVNTREISIGEGTAVINEYFVDHPEMVMGAHALAGGRFGKDEYTVQPHGEDLAGEIEKAVKLFPEGIAGEGNADNREYENTVEREGLFVEKEGKIFRVEGGQLVPLSWEHERSGKHEKGAAVRAYIGLRDGVRELLDLQRNPDAGEDAIASAIAELNRKHDEFVRRFGWVNAAENRRYLSLDADFPVGAAIEHITQEATPRESKTGRISYNKVTTISKSDILRTRTVWPFVRPEKAESVSDAVMISMVYSGRVDVPYVAELLGMTEEGARDELLKSGEAFEEPRSGMLTDRASYLSGAVKKKLADAKAAAKGDERFTSNVTAIEAVIPEDIPIEEVKFRLGTPWIPTKIIERFIDATLAIRANVRYVSVGDTDKWVVDTTGKFKQNEQNRSVWGMPEYLGVDLVEAGLNMRRIEVAWYDQDKKRHVDEEKSSVARQKLERLQAEFTRWALADTDVASELEHIYNDTHNGRVIEEIPVPSIEYYPNASRGIKLRDYQKKAVSKVLRTSALLDYGVGTGKTYIFITAAMEMRRLKTARKPMIVVQRATLSQYAESFQKLYPGAKVLIPTEEERAGENRDRLLSQIATGDYDAVVVPHSWFNAIPNDPRRMIDYIQGQVADIEQRMDDAKGDGDRITVKELEKLKARKEEKLKALRDKQSKANTLCFEDMGVDAILVDEAHAYKRSEFFTKMGNIRGIDNSSAGRSFDFALKAMHIREKTGGKNVVLATGTPISNTLAELWSFLRYIRPDLLEEYGITTFDAFAATFGRVVSKQEETTGGTFKTVERFAEFDNGPELLTMWRSAVETVLTEDLGLPLPKLHGGGYEYIALERDATLDPIIESIRKQYQAWEKMTGMAKRQNRHVPLVLYGMAKKLAIDPRLVNPGAIPGKHNKLARVAEEAAKEYRASGDTLGTQMIFLDNRKSNAGDFDAYRELRRLLLEKGIPAHEIALSDENSDEDRKAMLIENLRNGRVRIAIGHTETLGTGVDAPQHMVAIHHVDIPPRPMDFEQRNGRGVRVGNQNREIRIVLYGVKNTADSSAYQTLLRKQKFINQYKRGQINGRNFEDPFSEEQQTFADMQALLSPFGETISALHNMEKRIRELSFLKESFGKERREAREKIERIEKTIIPAKEKDIEKYRELQGRVDGIFPAKAITSVNFEGAVHNREDGIKAVREWAESAADGIIQRFAAEKYTARDWLAGEVKIREFREAKTILLNGEKFTLHVMIDPRESPYTGDNGTMIVNIHAIRYVLENETWSEFGSQPTGIAFSGMMGNFTRSMSQAGEKASEEEAEIRSARKEAESLREMLGKEFEFGAEMEKLNKDITVKKAELEKKSEDYRKAEEERTKDEIIDDGEEPRFFARTAGGEGKISGAEVMRAVHEIAGKFAVPVKVVATAKDLPEGIRDAAMRKQTGGDVVLGIYHGGKVYIVAEHMRSAEEAQKVFIHEAVGHYGLRKVMGKEFEDFLTFLVNDTKYGKEIRAFAASATSTGSATEATEGDLLVAADEWFAHQAEGMKANSSLWARFMFHVRKWLRAMGANIEYGKPELVELLRMAKKEAQNPRVNAQSGGEARHAARKYTPEEWRNGVVPDQVKLGMLEEMTPVEVDSSSMGDTKDKEALRKKAKEFYRTLGSAENRFDRREIKFVMRGYDEIAHHSADTKTIRMVPALKNLMNQAIPVFDEQNTDIQKRNVAAWHNYGIKVLLDGEEGYVRLTVREDNAGGLYLNFFYDAHMTLMREIKEGADVGLVPEARGIVASAPSKSKDKLIEWMRSVKGNREGRNETNEEPRFFARSRKEAEADIDSHMPANVSDAWEIVKRAWQRRDKNWSKNMKPDVGRLERFFSLLSHYAEKVPALYRAWEAAVRLPEYKYEIENALFRSADGSVKYAEIIDNFQRKGDKEEVKRWNEYIFRRDRDEIGFQVKTNKKTGMFDLVDLEGETVGSFTDKEAAWDAAVRLEVSRCKFSEEGAAALGAYRTIAHNIFRMLNASMLELAEKRKSAGLEPVTVLAWVNGKEIEVDLPKAMALMGEKRGWYMPRIRRQGEYMLYAHKDGKNPHMEFFDTTTALDLRAAQFERQGYTVTKDVSKRFSEEMFGNLGNIAAINELLKVAVNKMASGNAVVKPTKNFLMYGFHSGWRKTKDGTRTLILTGRHTRDYIPELFREHKGINRYVTSRNEDAWVFNNFSEADVGALLKELAEREELLYDAETEFAAILTAETANILRQRGALAHRLPRREGRGEDVVMGYEKNPVTAIIMEGKGVAGAAAKHRAAREMLAASTGREITWEQFVKRNPGSGFAEYKRVVNSRRIDPERQKGANDAFMILFEDVLRNEDRLDRVFGMVKGLAVLKYLAFRVAAPLVNLTAIPTSAAGSISGYANVSISKAMGNLGMAVSQYVRFKRGMGIDAEDAAIFEEIEKHGWHMAQFNRETVAALKGRHGRLYDSIMDIGMWLFGLTEQLNRVSTIAAAYKAIKGNHKGVWNEDAHTAAIREAKRISDRAHGVYGKANLPEWARGTGVGANAARAAYVFRTFVHNYILTMADLTLGKEKNGQARRAGLWMAFAPAVLGGTAASIPLNVLMGVLGGIMDDDPEEMLYSWVGDNLGYAGEMTARHGLTGFSGMTIKGSLEFDVSQMPTSVLDYLGAPGSIVTDVNEGARYLFKGNVWKAAEKALPNAAANIMKDWRESTEGLTSRTNVPVFFGDEQVRLKPLESAWKFFSFTPSRTTMIREKQWGEKKMGQHYGEMRTDIYTRIRAYFNQPVEKREKDKWGDILMDIQKYNIKARGQGLPLIDDGSVKTAAQKSYRPPKWERARKYVPDQLRQ